MLLKFGCLSFGVSDELTRLDLDLRLLIDRPPIVHRFDLLATRLLLAQMSKHLGLLGHLPVADAEPQREGLLLI
jgi:hypothetical protein